MIIRVFEQTFRSTVNAKSGPGKLRFLNSYIEFILVLNCLILCFNMFDPTIPSGVGKELRRGLVFVQF